MAQRRHHYEQAFQWYLRSARVPYVAVDEARKALLPEVPGGAVGQAGTDRPAGASLKSFDFVVYGPTRNVLVEIKGRRMTPGARTRLESWVTREDADSLLAWQDLFGGPFLGAFVFVYASEGPPPAALFTEAFEFRGRYYSLRAIAVSEYVGAMRTRSERWRTVHLPGAAFDRLARPLWGRPDALASSRNPGEGAPVSPSPLLGPASEVASTP